MHADRTNRAVLTVLALLALVLGVAGCLLSYGAFGSKRQHQPISDNQVWTWIGKHGAWLWPAIAAALAIVAILAVIWLIKLLFSTDRVHNLPVQVPASRGWGQLGQQKATAGRTTLAPGALTDAVSEEIESYRGVSSARARFFGDATEPSLLVRATVNSAGDLPALRSRIESEALRHARQAFGVPDMPVQLDLAVSERPASSRVR